MKKKALKLIYMSNILLLILFFIYIGTGCQSEYKYWTNEIDNFDSFQILDVFLTQGESKIIDFKQQFKNSNLSITKIVAKSTDEEVCTINENSIYAVGMGKAKVKVEIYSSKEMCCYVTTSANVYVVDSSNKDFIEVRTAQDLADMNQNKNGWYILKNDIDLIEYKNWEPIGNLPTAETPENNAFQGIFYNPEGFKIKNLTIKSSQMITQGKFGGCNGGLFGALDEAYIDGILLEDVYIDLTDYDGTLSSCAGGIAAQELNSVIRNCKVEGKIISQDRTGGIVGGSSWGKIMNCDFKGMVQSTIHAAGGIAGFGYIVKNCSVEALIEGAFASGGILGFKTVDYYLSDCSFKGELLGNGYKGETIGYTF